MFRKYNVLIADIDSIYDKLCLKGVLTYKHIFKGSILLHNRTHEYIMQKYYQQIIVL